MSTSAKKRRLNKKKQTTTPRKKETTTPTSKKKTITTPPKKKATTPAPIPAPIRKSQRQKVVKQPQPQSQPQALPIPVSTIFRRTSLSATAVIHQDALARNHHIDKLFSQFSEFDYDPYAHPSSEFQRLSKLKGWDWDSKFREYIPREARKAQDEFRTSLVRQFNHTYGEDENHLGAWQKLCGRLQYNPIPDTLEGCHALVKATHVNLIDLLAIENTGRPVHKYPTELALSEYTLRTDKIFPRNHLEAGNLLKHLLRRILDPREESSFQKNRIRRYGYWRTQDVGNIYMWRI